MGPQHLIRSAALALAVGVGVGVGVALLGCGGAAAEHVEAGGSRVTLGGPPGARGSHVQFVRAMPMAERVALVKRFKERNGADWTITLGGGGAPDDVDAIRGIVRRAKRGGDASADANANANANANADAGAEARELAIRAATAFVVQNADLLGLAPGDVATLSYTLAYAVDVKRAGSAFRFIVDADTGDLLEDAVVPVLPASPLDEP